MKILNKTPIIFKNRIRYISFFLISGILLTSFSGLSNNQLFNFIVSPNATVSVSKTNVCIDEVVTITFKGSGGIAPYTFTYTLNGTEKTIKTTGTKSLVSFSFSRSTPNNYVFSLTKVVDNSGDSQVVTGQDITVKVNTPPTVDFTITNNNACSGEAVAFNSKITGSGTYTYQWDFGNGNTSDVLNPSEVFTNIGCNNKIFQVKLLVKDDIGCATSLTKQVTVLPKPDIAFRDKKSRSAVFSNCDNASATSSNYDVIVENISNSSCIASFFIDWGDGSTTSSASFPASHTYKSIGVFKMKISATSNNGCKNEVTYEVKNVSNPAGGFESPGNTSNLCIPTGDLNFGITNWGLNSSDTQYFVDFGDGTKKTFVQSELEASASYNAAAPEKSTKFPTPHSYTTGSCSQINNEFIAKLTVVNACAATEFTISNITVLESSVAKFESINSSCIDRSVIFNNKSIIGDESGCLKNADVIWDFGDGKTLKFFSVNTVNDTNHVYSTAGIYTVSLSIQSKCGISVFTKQICIEPKLTPSFSVNTNEGCIPLNLTTTNTTDKSKLCSTPIYKWSVVYASDNCGTTPDWGFTNNTTETSENPEFVFKNPGKYTITQRVITGCGTETFSKVINVKKPPTANITKIEDVCGSVTFTPKATIENCTNNTSGITYNWTFTGGSPGNAKTLNPGNVTFSTPGTHTVTLEVTNDCGVSNKASQTFEVFESPMITNTDLTQEICSNQSTSKITLTSNNVGTTYAWTTTATGNVTGYITNGNSNSIAAQTLINNSSTVGTVKYTVIPKKGICEGAAVDFIVTVNPTPIITTQPVSSEVCKDGVPTELSVVYQKGTGPPFYQWFSNTADNTSSGTLIPGATTAKYQPLATTVGTTYYYVEISFNSGGCSKITSKTATVKVVPQLTLNAVSGTQTICIGGTVGEMSVTYSGGTGTASYQWYKNTTKTNTGGTKVAGATKRKYTPTSFSTGGSFYYYATVSLTGNGCNSVTSDVFQVDVLTDPIIDVQPIVGQELCQGATPVDLTVSVSGGTSSSKSYQWFKNTSNNTTSGSIIPTATGNTFTPSTTTVGSVYYYVVVSQTASGCSVTSDTSLVKINEAAIITTQPVSSEVCKDGVPTELSVVYQKGTGTPSYQWFSNTADNTSSGTLIPGATTAKYQPLATAVGTTYYYVEISFNSGGCSKITSKTATVKVVPQLILNAVSGTQTICVGGTVGEMSVTYSSGTGTASYQWYKNTTKTNTGGSKVAGATKSKYTPTSFSTAGSFYYYATVSLTGGGCNSAKSDVFQVDVLTDPIIDVQPIVGQELCQGAIPVDLTVSVSGGTSSSKSYQWFKNTSNNTTSGSIIPTATGNTFTPSTTTVGSVYYYVVVSQTASGCSVTSDTSLVKINEAAIITTQPVSTEVCKDGVPTELSVVYQKGTGTPTYQWFSNTADNTSSGTLIPGATTAKYQPLATTVGTTYYYVEISFNSGGCSKITSKTAKIVINEIPVINSAKITIYSETTFNFNPSTIIGNTVPKGTKYTWPSPTFNPAGAIIGASAMSNPNDQISQTLKNTGTSPVKVTYIITPATTKCTGNSFTLEVTVNPSIQSNAEVFNNTCFESNDGTITTNIVGGVPFDTGKPYLVSWSGPNGFTSNNTTITNLLAGLYTVRIEDKGGVFIIEKWTVTQPVILSITKDLEKNISCFQGNDGAIALSISGGTLPYRYNWTTSNGSGIKVNTEDQNTLTAGTYRLEVLDKNNCTTSANFTLTEPKGLKIETVFKQDILCFGDATGSIEIKASGGTQKEISPGVFDYLYSWSGPNGFISSSKKINNLIAGTYTITVTDNLGCTSNTAIVVNQSSKIDIHYIKTDVTCYGAANGAIDVTVTGGKAPYKISWSNLANGFSLSNLSADTYIATITDANNCVNQVSIIIKQPIFFIKPVVTPISCNENNDGAIDLNLTGGIAPFSVTWSDDASAGIQRNNLAPGSYTVVLLDSDVNQCPIKQTFILTNPPAMAVSSKVTDAIDCTIVNSGQISLEVSGGSKPYSFLWNTNETTKDLNNIPQGDYSVKITDVNGCSVSKQFKIFRQEPITISFEETIIKDCNLKTISIQNKAKVKGGYLPYTYSWSDGVVSGPNNNTMTTQQSGSYIVTITDAKGCIEKKSIQVKVPTIGYADFRYSAFALSTYNFLSIEDPIQFTNLSTGDIISLNWNFGDGSITSNEQNPVHTYSQMGSFKVVLTVEFSAGCTENFERIIDITQGYSLVHPTAFTPNGDGYNETMRPSYRGFTNLKMTIYDTWGTAVYTEEGTNLKGWDGFVGGKPAENGNYVMIVKGTTFYKKEIIKSSPVTLLK